MENQTKINEMQSKINSIFDDINKYYSDFNEKISLFVFNNELLNEKSLIQIFQKYFGEREFNIEVTETYLKRIFKDYDITISDLEDYKYELLKRQKRIDEQNKKRTKKIIYVLSISIPVLIVSFFLYNLYSEKQIAIEENLIKEKLIQERENDLKNSLIIKRVITPQGLNVREKPSSNSKKIGSIAFNDRVIVLSKTGIELTISDTDFETDEIKQISGEWVKIRSIGGIHYKGSTKLFRDISGFVFDGFLNEQKTILTTNPNVAFYSPNLTVVNGVVKSNGNRGKNERDSGRDFINFGQCQTQLKIYLISQIKKGGGGNGKGCFECADDFTKNENILMSSSDFNEMNFGELKLRYGSSWEDNSGKYNVVYIHYEPFWWFAKRGIGIGSLEGTTLKERTYIRRKYNIEMFKKYQDKGWKDSNPIGKIIVKGEIDYDVIDINDPR